MVSRTVPHLCLFIRIGLFKLLLFSFLQCTYAAEVDSYRFDNWTTDSGLPQNSILSIIQTRDGYLWLTTFDGLVRFDGVRFTVFDKNNTPGITGNRFISVFEDAEHSIWSGTDSGEIFRDRNGSFQSFGADKGFGGDVVTDIKQSADGKISAVKGEKLLTLNERNYFESYPPGDSEPIQHIYWGRSGRRWVQQAGGIYEFWENQKISYPLELKDTGGVYEDENGDLWLGEQSMFYRLKDGRVTRFDSRGAQEEIKRKTIIAVPNKATYADAKGFVWSGNARLFILNPQTGQIAEMPAADPTTLISAITGDREGNIWIGTNGHGLTRASRKIISTYSAADGMRTDNIFPATETRSGEIWLGAGGAVKIAAGKIHNIKIPASPVFGSPQSFYEDREGRFWIGGTGGVGYYRDDKFTDLSDTFRLGGVVVIHEDRSGNLWFGSDTGGLIEWKNTIKAHYTTESGLPDNGVRDIYEDARGVLWIATYGGLVKDENGRLATFSEREGLAGDHVRTITGDADGTLWIGTYDNGLSRFKDGKFTNYNTSNGLFNNGVFRILEDAAGNFWMSSNRGIYRVAKQQLNDYAAGRISAITSIAYGKDDGMLSTECNGGRQPAGFKAHDGRLWFPTQKGVVVIDPAAVAFNAQPPPVVIEKIKIDNTAVALTDNLKIEPGQSIVEIDYAGLSLIKSEQVRYKYKIEGLDGNWIDAGTRRSAYYSYLPAGEYTFTVIASNADGVWNEQGASLKIKVLPPFWKTWWFYILVVLVCLSAAYLFYRRRIRQLTREREAQELMSRRLIESQEQERQRLAGELHDSLSQNLVIIKNRAMMSLSDREDTASAFEQIEEIAEAASETLAEVREIAYRLRPFQIDRLGLTEAIEVMVKKVGNVNLTIERKLDKIDALLSPEMEINFYRIVQESLNNIVKHSQSSRAEVIIKHEEQAIQLSISDNGRGFDAAAMLQKESAGASGFGLMSVFERARILGAIPRIESTENGTTIHLNILLK